MTTVNNTVSDLVGNLAYQWPALSNGDDGQPAAHGGTGDRTVQVTGTFGSGGTLAVEGSLDGTNWFSLRDTLGVSLAFSTAGLKAVLENAVFIRPRVTAGDGTTSLSVILNVRR